MASFNNKKYSATVENLEKMADGAKQHSAEPGFPGQVTEEGLKNDKQVIEDAREVYEQAENAARVKFDEYELKLKAILKQYSNYATQLYGFYGKKNQIVADFGLKPYKSRGPKGDPPPEG